jgi:hypothetical protein
MTLVNLTGAQRGVNADEVGINIREFKTEVEPEYKDFLNGKNGEKRGFAVAAMQKVVSIDGEVMGSTGLMGATATTAFAPANSTAYFGAPTTGLYLDKGTVTENRDGWKDVSAQLTANAGVP